MQLIIYRSQIRLFKIHILCFSGKVTVTVVIDQRDGYLCHIVSGFVKTFDKKFQNILVVQWYKVC